MHDMHGACCIGGKSASTLQNSSSLQVGVKEDEHSRCLRAELDKGITKRTTFTVSPKRPGGDLLAQASAAFAAAAIAYDGESKKSSLRKRCEETAKDLFRDAMKQKGVYSDSISECKKTYPSNGFETHAFYAAAMLYKMTGDDKYKQVPQLALNTPSVTSGHLIHLVLQQTSPTACSAAQARVQTRTLQQAG
jgi:hypothetical protein